MASNHNDIKQQKSSIDLNCIVEPTFAHCEAAQQTSSMMTPLLNDYVVIGDTDIPVEPNSELMKSLVEHKFIGNNRGVSNTAKSCTRLRNLCNFTRITSGLHRDYTYL